MSNTMYFIEATNDTPEFKIDMQKGEISIKGVSMPENAFEFFEPIYRELQVSLEGSPAKLQVYVALSYMNSMSNKQIMKMIKLVLSKAIQSTITWAYAEGDDLLRIKGEEIAAIFDNAEIKLEELK